MSYIAQLQKLGFTDKEARVYIASLKTGSARATEIAREAGLPKSTTLDLLFVLNRRGMIATHKQKNRYVFEATDPAAIGAWLERRVSLFESLRPKLETLEYSGKRPLGVVQTFDNVGSMPTVWQYVVAHAHEVYILMGNQGEGDSLTQTLIHFTQLRLRHKVPARILVQYNGTPHTNKPVFALSETRCTHVPVEAGVLVVWDGGYVSVSLEPVHAILVNDSCASSHVLSLTRYLWEQAS